ncbi:MAG: COX15/CtaA family protein [Lacipirellulaceae bacterium]
MTSPWPHRWAWLLCLATFPLVWVGGLITTTDAGMAVPDWPGTYGYNMFLYPWQTWFFGPWDLFIEHGHRLLASGVGLLAIGLVVATWRAGAPPRLRRWALIALALVILQGVLGGLRVVLNERVLALAHGSTGPLFFALTAALVVATGPRPRDGTVGAPRWATRWLAALVLLQVVVGATLRHVPEGGRPTTFATHVQTHLVLAAVVGLLALFVGLLTARRASRGLRGLGAAVGVLVVLQIALGFGAWVAKYRYPEWLPLELLATSRSATGSWEPSLAAVTLEPRSSGGWGETHTVTAHSAIGSLLLGASTALAVAAARRRGLSAPAANDPPTSFPIATPAPPLSA